MPHGLYTQLHTLPRQQGLLATHLCIRTGTHSSLISLKGTAVCTAPRPQACTHAPQHHAGELLETLPPGVDELVAISNVVRFIRAPEYSHFTRIIFDTAPTGHTLRLLGAPDFLDASLGAWQ